MIAPLRHRTFRLLFSGQLVSNLGDWLDFLALAVLIAYEWDRGPGSLAALAVTIAIPWAFIAPVSGVLADRWPKRPVMVAADLARAALVLGLVFAPNIWVLLPIVFAKTVCSTLFGPAEQATIRATVPEDDLLAANSLSQLATQATKVVGPALGGLIVAAGSAGTAFIVDAGTFAISIGCVALMHRTGPSKEDADHGSVIGDIREGFAYVRSQVWLWGTFLAATLGYLIFWGPSEVLLPFVVRNEMSGSAADLGLIFAIGGIGAMSSAVIMGNRHMPRRNMTFIYVVWTLSTLAIAGYGFAHLPWQAMAACFAFNALEGAGTIVWATTKGRLVPGRLLGRVSSFDWFISIALVPISYAFTGPVAGALGAQRTLVGAGLIGGTVTLAFLFLPGMRDVERDERLLGATVSASPDDTGLGALEGPMAPISAGQSPFPDAATSSTTLRSSAPGTDI